MIVEYNASDGKAIYFSIKNIESPKFIEKFGYDQGVLVILHNIGNFDGTNPRITIDGFELTFKSQRDFDDFTMRKLNGYELLPINAGAYVGCLSVGFNSNFRKIYYQTRSPHDKEFLDSKGKPSDTQGIFSGEITYEDFKEEIRNTNVSFSNKLNELDKVETFFRQFRSSESRSPIEHLKAFQSYLFNIAEKRRHLHKVKANFVTKSFSSHSFFNGKDKVQYEVLSVKSAQVIQNISDNPLLISLLFFDGIKMDSSYTLHAKKERNYFIALALTLYHALHHINDKLSIDFLNDLHKSCTFGVDSLNPGSDRGIHREGNIAYFISDYLSIKDKSLIIRSMQAMEKNKYSGLLDRYIEKNTETVSDKKVRMGYCADCYSRQKDISERNQVEFSPAEGENNYENIINNAITLHACFVKSSNLKTDKDMIETIDSVLLDYERDLEDADQYKNADQNQYDHKIRLAIIMMVQNLERIHPFADANCRTLCMMLLNRELIRHGQNPTLMDNPNDIDCLDEETLCMFVQRGQERYENLIQGKQMAPYCNIRKDEKVVVSKEKWIDNLDRHRDDCFIKNLYSKQNQRDDTYAFSTCNLI